MNKFSKNDTSQVECGLLPFHDDERHGTLPRLAMLAATLVLPLAGTFALTERPARSVAVVESPTPALSAQAAMPALAALDEKN